MGTLGLFIFSADGGELSGTVADGGGQRRVKWVSGYLVPWAPLGGTTDELWEFSFRYPQSRFPARYVPEP